MDDDVEKMWRDAVKFWLLKCFKISNPTPDKLELTDKYLNSMNIAKEDLISFCKVTGWKYG